MSKANKYYIVNNGEIDRGKYLNIEQLNGQTTLPRHWWPKIAPTPSASDAGIEGDKYILNF